MRKTAPEAKSAQPKTGFFASLSTLLRGEGSSFGLGLLLLAVAASVFPSSGLAAGTPIFESAFGPDGTNGTSFGAPGAVGVDEGSHDVYVADYEVGTVSKFDEDGTPTNFSALGENDISGFSFFGGEGLNQIAVNSTSHDFYVVQYPGAVKAFHADGTPAEFSALGESEIGGFSEACGVAVDADGNIYVGEFTAGEVEIFKPNGEALNSFEVSEPCNVAVDSTGDVYVSHYFFAGIPGIEKFTPSESPVTVTTTYPFPGILIDPVMTFALTVNPVSHELFADERPSEFAEPKESQIAQYDESGTRIGEFAGTGEPGALTASEGIAVDGATSKIYVTDTEGEQQVEIFVPPPAVPPEVKSTSFSNVTATSATVQAQINPKSFDTSYRFQYVTQAQFEASGFTGAAETAETDLGSAGTPQTASAHLSGLAPDTTYRFRVIAENENGETSSAEPALGFTTFAVPPPGLPDGRTYEMVSPPQKLGEVFPLEPVHQLGSSCPFECLPGSNAQLMPMQTAPDGEAIVYQGQPFSEGLAAGPNEYLSSRSPSGWTTQSVSPLRASEGESQAYDAFSSDLTRGVLFQIEPSLSDEAPTEEGKSFANLYLRAADGSLQPVVSEAPPNRSPGRLDDNRFRIIYRGANSGSFPAEPFSHLIFEANDALTGEIPGIAPEAPEVEPIEPCGLPGAQCNLYEWVEGSLHLVNVLPGNATAASGAVIGSGRLLVPHPLSEGPDVSHAISDDGSRIFWSEEASGQAYVRIDGEETQKIEDSGKFLTASADGSEVLLSDGCLYDLEAEACEHLTGGQGGFEGILGAAEDLSRIYFVDTAVLTGAEENANGEQAEAGEFNLYGWEEGDPTFIGTLLEIDNNVGSLIGLGDWRAQPGGRTAQVTPDGRYLAFMSKAPLTSYDNEIKSGKCGAGPFCYAVFEYDANSATLTCASCNPSGHPPLGESNLSLIREAPAFLPLPQPGNLTADGQGRLFFESQDVLSPRDSNGHIQDVYEWEPNGIGNCERLAGCVLLISSGHAANDSMFLDSTPSGNNAFIITREQLLPQDKDQRLDVYDARVGGGFEEVGTAPCSGEACKGQVASPPAQPSAGSGQFSGPANPPRHHKHKKHKHKKRSATHNRGGAK